MLCHSCNAEIVEPAVICPQCGALMVDLEGDIPAPVDLPSFAVALDTYELMVRHTLATLFGLVNLYTRHAQGKHLDEAEQEQLANWQSTTEDAKNRLRGIGQDIRALDMPTELEQSSREMLSAISDYVIAFVELQTAFGSGEQEAADRMKQSLAAGAEKLASSGRHRALIRGLSQR